VLDDTPLRPDEERLLDEKVSEHGSRWQLIASFFPHRGRNMIKNNWLIRHKRPTAAQRPECPKNQDRNKPTDAAESMCGHATTATAQERDDDCWGVLSASIF
jgi:hypothetical protein